MNSYHLRHFNKTKSFLIKIQFSKWKPLTTDIFISALHSWNIYFFLTSTTTTNFVLTSGWIYWLFDWTVMSRSESGQISLLLIFSSAAPLRRDLMRSKWFHALKHIATRYTNHKYLHIISHFIHDQTLREAIPAGEINICYSQRFGYDCRPYFSFGVR